MAQGFKAKQPKQPKAKKSSSSKQKLDSCSHEAEIQSEIEAFLEKDKLENPEQYALAWQLGAYNPLNKSARKHARFLEADEEDWLFLAKEVGWLQAENELDAIYFTAPPPNFDPNQADWYIRPDLTSCFEEPELLREAAAKYPIPYDLMFQAIKQYTQRLGWNLDKTQAFIQEITDRPVEKLTNPDCTAVLLELRRL